MCVRAPLASINPELYADNIHLMEFYLNQRHEPPNSVFDLEYVLRSISSNHVATDGTNADSWPRKAQVAAGRGVKEKSLDSCN